MLHGIVELDPGRPAECLDIAGLSHPLRLQDLRVCRILDPVGGERVV
jgi:hypothetical protein